MVSLCNFVIRGKHKFCVIDFFEIDGYLNLYANFDCSALGVLLKDYVFAGLKTVVFGKVEGNLTRGYVILVFAAERFPMANKGVGKIAWALPRSFASEAGFRPRSFRGGAL